MTLGILSLIISGLIIWFWEPVWWTESLVLIAIGLSLMAVIKRIFQNTKTAFVIASGVMGLIILNRLDILDLLTGILLVTVLLLISLIN